MGEIVPSGLIWIEAEGSDCPKSLFHFREPEMSLVAARSYNFV